MEKKDFLSNQVGINLRKISFKTSFVSKFLIIGVINLLEIIFLIWLLLNLPQKAVEIKKLKNLAAKATQNKLPIIQAEIAESQQKFEKLKTVFPDENGLINFIKTIDDLKKNKKLIQFSFAADNLLKDKNGYLSLPVVFEFKGNFEEINNAFLNLQQLPFLIKPVTIEIKHLGVEELSLKYGGILYVSQNYGQN